jgi:hypothetical protein
MTAVGGFVMALIESDECDGDVTRQKERDQLLGNSGI